MCAQGGEDWPQTAVTVRNFSCNLLSTVAVCFSSPNCQPEVLYYMCQRPAPPSLSFWFSSTEGAASELQMLQFPAFKPHQTDLQQHYLK